MAFTTIDDPSAYFHIQLYTGSGSEKNITNDANAGDFKPDLIWIKQRNATTDHGMFDSTRGVTKNLKTNVTDAESTEVQSVKTFNTDGFTLGTSGDYNGSSDTHVAWQWKCNGGTTSTNDDGTVDVTIQVNSTAGFSIMKWTGAGNTTSTVGHGLGVKPHFFINKGLESAQNWSVAWPYDETAKLMALNTTAGFFSASGMSSYNASTFVDGSGGDAEDRLALCWKEVQGYSKFGSYTGNGAEPDGPFIYTGFSPAWMIIHGSSEDGQGWVLCDHKRDIDNIAVHKLFSNVTAAESSAVGDNNWDFLSNGFKIKTQDDGMNKSGVTFHYAAFAASPFVTSDDGGSIPATAR